ncbi:hypothetical protein AAG612_13880 [Citromicrobium bathyomarinum]|uniref:hypothetical protein n=1 Tax=Citromicrobium bathyomarinum TaxID=72174 RepID=UPI00315A920E
MKRFLCTISCAFILYGCGDASADDSSELATAKAEAAAAKAETAAMKAEMAASGSPDDAAATATPPAQNASPGKAPKVASAPTGNGKYRMPTADELANGVNANCDVTIEGYTYSGPCLFDGFGGASFMVSRADGYPMTSQFEEVIVEADTKKIAMMSFRDTDGELQTGGQVSRASTKDACWNGDLLKVCAYAKKF